MFVCVARITLQIPESGSLKAKRMVVRKVTDRVKARFNTAIAEVADNDLWQKATLGLAVVGNDRRHCDEQMGKILHAIEEMYVAPVISRESESLAFGEQMFGNGGLRSLADVASEEASGKEETRREPGADLMADLDRAMQAARSERTMAEAEGMGDWEEREEREELERSDSGTRPRNLDDARARARSLRNPRDWEK